MSDATNVAWLKWRLAPLVALCVWACGEEPGLTLDISPPDPLTSSSPEPDVAWRDVTMELGVDFVHRAGLAATVISYRARSALREVGKVLGLSEDTVGALAGQVWGRHGNRPTRKVS